MFYLFVVSLLALIKRYYNALFEMSPHNTILKTSSDYVHVEILRNQGHKISVFVGTFYRSKIQHIIVHSLLASKYLEKMFSKLFVQFLF